MWVSLRYNQGVSRVAFLSAGSPFPYLFQFLDTTYIPWLIAPFHIQSQQWLL